MYLCTKLTNMIRELLSKRERPMEQVSDFELEQIAVEEARLKSQQEAELIELSRIT